MNAHRDIIAFVEANRPATCQEIAAGTGMSLRMAKHYIDRARAELRLIRVGKTATGQFIFGAVQNGMGEMEATREYFLARAEEAREAAQGSRNQKLWLNLAAEFERIAADMEPNELRRRTDRPSEPSLSGRGV